MNNSIIDLAIRIKNGYLAKRETISSPYSKFKEEFLKKLKELKFIKDFEIEGDLIKKFNITLLYEDGTPSFNDIKIFSKPGRRWYLSYKDLKPLLSGYGCYILSTPKGILSDKEAKDNKVGGELLISIW